MYILFLKYLNFVYPYGILAFQLKYGNSPRIQERALQLMKLSVKISQMGLKCRMWVKLSDGRCTCFIFYEFLTMWHKVAALSNQLKWATLNSYTYTNWMLFLISSCTPKFNFFHSQGLKILKYKIYFAIRIKKQLTKKYIFF